MSIVIHIHFYATKTPNGLIHVQNFINGLPGQHHIHNEESFNRWRKRWKKEALDIEEGECDCGLNVPGMVREYDGAEWFNDKFLKEEAMATARTLRQSKLY